VTLGVPGVGLRCRAMCVRSAGAVLLAVVVGLGLSACGSETADESAGGDAGAAIAAGASSTAEGSTESSDPEDSGGSEAEPGGSSTGPVPSPSIPCSDPEAAPQVPNQSPPPTMAGDMEPQRVPNGIGGEDVLQFGELIVDVGPQGCIDIPTHFRAGQRVLVHSFADDGNVSDVRVYGPDGAELGEWQTGERETVEGYDFYNDTPMPTEGTYIFRVIHRDGHDDPFAISFFGDP
jgi:hypothetical protein